MLIVISPAKKLDFSDETRYTAQYSQPGHLDAAQVLIDTLAAKTPAEIAELMDLSPKLAELNAERYRSFRTPFTPETAKQALLAFKGDAYLSFALGEYGDEDFAFAQHRLRILSGLYGVLRPLDLIQPYRLEMGTALKTGSSRNLYEFWGDRIADALNAALAESGSSTLVNLASDEYFKSVRVKRLQARVITPVFKEWRKGKLQSIFLYAKQARGAMADYAIRQRVTDPEALKAFTGMGYGYDPDASDADTWVFAR
ncbi:MAG: peroxide stress protein YaaA [Bacteroidia bacterium]|nr:peroxide stress protein YaaA [Bacteroidia bacterium]